MPPLMKFVLRILLAVVESLLAVASAIADRLNRSPLDRQTAADVNAARTHVLGVRKRLASRVRHRL
jgi:hypothetical protein